ncbi:MAG TPA: lysylphosphatidylglycerol synthase transmembrane domain-containing protein [Candidatus Acidoferrales bacterium]|nr:lysylphosphatidylglycerol synthase transmembrane domain-containing protein [Candidatus Acidoferrales bacterium]
MSFQSERDPTDTSRPRPGQDAVPGYEQTTVESEQRKRWHAVRRALLHYGGSVVALALLFRFLPGRQVLHALAKLPAELWIAVLAGYLATHLLGVAKWRLMVNTAGTGLNYLQSARCYFAGLFGTLFLPSLIGGDLVRVTLAMRYGKTKAGALLGSFIDRLIDFAALVLLAAIGALLAPTALERESRRVFLLIGAAAIVGLALAALAVTLIPFRRLSFRTRRRAVGLRRAARSMTQRPRAALAALSIAVVSQLSFICLSVLLADACGLRLVFRAWLFAWPIAKLSAAIPVTQGGIGIREAALAGLLVPFGAPPTLTVAAGLAWEAVSISGALVGGVFALAMRRRSS